jgi:hypothetical protein
MSRPAPGTAATLTSSGLLERAGPTVMAVVALGLLLALAWLVPPLAIVVVWPLLFVVPGWTAISWAAPRLAAPARLGLAIVISVVASTHLVHWLAVLTGGYGRGTIFAAAILLALPLPLALVRVPRLDVMAALRRADRALWRSWPAFAVGGLAAAFVAVVLAGSIWRATPTGIVSGGTNWSDFGVHLSIAESLNAGNFPPQVPYFAGAPLVYHWFADFHAAIAARAAGLFSPPAMVVQSAVLAGALALVVHGLARHLFGRRGRRAAVIAAVLVIFAGGLGWIRFVTDVREGLGTPLELIARNSYDNQWLTDWPFFRIPSVMGTGLLAHRATTAGLPILAGSLLLLAAGLPSAEARRRGWRDRARCIGLAGVLGALLAPFHFFFFPALLLLAFLYVVDAGRLIDRGAPRNALVFLAPFALALPFAIPPLLQADAAGTLKLVAGWESAPFAEQLWTPFSDAPTAVGFFYLTNLGIVFVLAIAAIFTPSLPRRGFLAGWLVAMFLVPNVVQVSLIGFDMNKYFQAMWIAAALLAAWLIRRWPAWALAAVLAVAVPSPLLVAGWTATSNLQILTHDEVAAADWIRANTPERSVFVTDGWVTSATDAAGRLRLTTFGPYIANLGYSPDERIAAVETIYCAGDPDLSAHLMRSYGAHYVIDAARPIPCPAPTDFAGGPFEQVYANTSLRVWRLTDP